MLAAQALALEDSDRAKALELALKAHKLDPALVPAALVAARVLVTQASTRKASKILKETWVLSPHPELADVQAQSHPRRHARGAPRPGARAAEGRQAEEAAAASRVRWRWPAPRSAPSAGTWRATR